MIPWKLFSFNFISRLVKEITGNFKMAGMTWRFVHLKNHSYKQHLNCQVRQRCTFWFPFHIPDCPHSRTNLCNLYMTVPPLPPPPMKRVLQILWATLYWRYSWHCRLDYQPLFGKMSPHSSGAGRQRKSSLLTLLLICILIDCANKISYTNLIQKLKQLVNLNNLCNF